ncbi:MAG: trimeric intracellular cation channel family protein [Clostridia bacterium]|nr:trimeric intracellular cation channel family protein [Clostridia bacterium]
MNELIMTVLEIIGTIAFSISGALIGISCGLDIFGVVFLGVITSVGGGMLRDVLVGKCPPAIFSNTYIFAIAALTAIIVFIVAYINREHFQMLKERIEKINNVFDAIGLSAFSVTGTEIACAAGFSDKLLLVILMGMTTGVGGGIFRDILVSKTPYVLKKHIYALASIAGSLIYYIIRMYIGKDVIGTIVAMLSVFIVRMLATKYRWELPKLIFKI